MTTQEDRAAALRQRYLQTQVETASPVQRLLMLQHRLLQDLQAASDAFEPMRIEVVHRNLVHAQAIVRVLRDSLKGSDWDGAEPLRAVYWFIHQRLVDCNVRKDATLLPVCISLIQQVVDANSEAAARAADAACEAVQVA